MRRSMNVRAEEVGRASLQGEMTCPDCPLTKTLAQRGFAEAARILHHVPWEHLTINEAALQALMLEAVGLNQSKAHEPSCSESHHL
jgi:hypothetical protein